MKTHTILLIFLVVSTKALSQDTAWSERSFNNILTLKLPKTVNFTQQSFIQSYSGFADNHQFTFNYYDTAMNVKDSQTLKISLNGFMHGVLMQVSDSQFVIQASDAKIGGLPGILVELIARDTTAPIQQLIYFATMANRHYYSFSSATRWYDKSRSTAEKFFGSIRFQLDRIEESKYDLKSMVIH
jgi:hypothetical protein